MVSKSQSTRLKKLVRPSSPPRSGVPDAASSAKDAVSNSVGGRSRHPGAHGVDPYEFENDTRTARGRCEDDDCAGVSKNVLARGTRGRGAAVPTDQVWAKKLADFRSVEGSPETVTPCSPYATLESWQWGDWPFADIGQVERE